MATAHRTNESSIELLLQQFPHLWRGRSQGHAEVFSTGFAALDAVLPGGGWPRGTLIELAPHCSGIGELTLPLPVLQTIAREKKQIALVRPPYTPYAPALLRAGLPLKQLLWIAESDDEHARWAAEQLLREGAGAVLLWSDARDDRAMRRLQLAAETGRALAFVYREPVALQEASSAAVRIALRPAGASLHVEIIKARRGQPASVAMDLPWALQSS